MYAEKAGRKQEQTRASINSLRESKCLTISFCMVVVVSETANRSETISWAFAGNTRSSSAPNKRFTLNLGLNAPNGRLEASFTT